VRSLFGTLRDVDLTVVAPSVAHVPEWLSNALVNDAMYQNMIDEIQRFRGNVYVHDKAIPASSLDKEGRHYSDYDYQAWHIIFRDRREDLCGAIRVGLVSCTDTDVEDLQVLRFLAKMPDDQRTPLEAAVRGFLGNCRLLQPSICEPGAWAVAEDVRKGRLAPVLAASIWSLLRVVGGASGVATATTRHGSADILKKMGGFDLILNGVPLVPFYDSYHACYMELVGFDSSYLNPRLEATVTEVQEYMGLLPIITRGASSPPAPPDGA
jgi:hypothetical protein